MEDIWQSWGKHYENNNIQPSRICKDGVINTDKYYNAPAKILFCLKEVNDYKDRDLREMLNDGPKYQMWHTISRWAAGLLSDFNPNFNKIDNYEQMKNALIQIAAINLKKTSGGNRADMSVINAFAKQDRELLIKQIELINPEILIACGTFDILIWLLDLKVDPDNISWKKHPPVYDAKREFWVIPWCHPGRVDNALTYQQLQIKYKLIDNFNS